MNTITDAMRAADEGLAQQEIAAQQTLREMLALIEDTSNYVAKATRNITTATPERRKLREEMESSLLSFLQATGSPEAARAYTVQPSTTVSLMLSQSLTAFPPAPADDAAQQDMGRFPARRRGAHGAMITEDMDDAARQDVLKKTLAQFATSNPKGA